MFHDAHFVLILKRAEIFLLHLLFLHKLTCCLPQQPSWLLTEFYRNNIKLYVHNRYTQKKRMMLWKRKEKWGKWMAWISINSERETHYEYLNKSCVLPRYCKCISSFIVSHSRHLWCQGRIQGEGGQFIRFFSE